jgi:hypothetical protein
MHNPHFNAKVLLLVAATAVTSLAPVAGAVRADDAAVSAAHPDGPGVETIKRSSDGKKEHISTTALDKCQGQWNQADSDRDGVVSGDEIANYNTHVRSEKQPLLPEGSRLDKADFLAACSSTDVHE